MASAAPTPTAPAPARPRLTEAQWAEAKADFELGVATATQLAKKYGIQRDTVVENMKKRGAVYGSRSKVVEEASIDAAKTDQQKRVEEVVAMKEKQRKLIETTQQLAAKVLMDSIRDSTPVSQKAKDVLTLKNVMTIFATGRAELWEIYGLNDDKDLDNELPEFAVSEYTPEELAAITRSGSEDEMTPDEALAELERQAALDGQGDDPLEAILAAAED